MEESPSILTDDLIKQNLETQLSEVEMLQSMFNNPGEIKLEDKNSLVDIQEFIENHTEIIPSFLDLTLNLLIENEKFELCVTLSHEYPECEPDLFVRNEKLNRTQHTKINKDLTDYIGALPRGEVCIYSAVMWLQENADKYIVQEDSVQDSSDKNKNTTSVLIRLWIYSHHIYSKTKRREILNLANALKINGFCMPGKPGIICVEGPSDECLEWWQTIKSMNWKRIFCKVQEECNDENTFLKFSSFEEVSFQSNGGRCNHMDIGELHKYLEVHNCSYIFKELFGVEGK